MKYILRTIVMALGCLLSAGVAEANQQLWQSTARIIKVTDITKMTAGQLPPSRTGVVLGHAAPDPETGRVDPLTYVYTVLKSDEHLVDSETEYLVLFPITGGGSTTKGVVACRARFTGKVDDRLIHLAIPDHSSLPPIVATSHAPVKTGKDATMISFAYDVPAHAEAKDIENIGKIQDMLGTLLKETHPYGTVATRQSFSSLSTAFNSYMNVFEQTNKVSSSRSETSDEDRFYIQNMEIREHMVGAPVFIDGSFVGMSETDENMKGECRYIGARTIEGHAYAMKIALNKVGKDDTPQADVPTTVAPPEDAAPQAESDNLVKGLLIAAVVLVVLLLVVVILKKRGDGGGGGSHPKLVMTLKGSDGKTIQVTSKMVRNNASLGRSSSCDVKLEDSSVSGHHAHFCAVGSRAAIQDDGSTNGSFVNGERLQPGSPKTLHPGDVIKLGTYELRVK